MAENDDYHRITSKRLDKILKPLKKELKRGSIIDLAGGCGRNK